MVFQGWQQWPAQSGEGGRRSNTKLAVGTGTEGLCGQEPALRKSWDPREHGHTFYNCISLTWDIICSEEIKTKMQSKWPTVTQESPEVQIIPLWAFYSTWLGAHKVWHTTFKSLPCDLVSCLCFCSGAWKSCMCMECDVTTAILCSHQYISSLSIGNWKDEP